MKKLFLLLFILPVACTTTPFSPYELGISDKTWQKYTPQQQNEILQRHQTMMANLAANAPKPGATSSCLTVTIANGKALMPPFTKKYQFQPATFKIAAESCTSFGLTSKDKTASVSPYACYKDNIFLLDPSKYEADKMYGTVKVYKTPLWVEGFTYANINTTGFVRFYHADVTIKEQQLTPEVCMGIKDKTKS
jgi:hypothetical protein